MLFLALVLVGCGAVSPVPANTPTPTRTIAPPTVTATQTLTPTPTLPPSVQEFDNKIAPFNPDLFMCGDSYPSSFDFSPDGTWLATSCYNDKVGNISLTNINGKFWHITDKQLFGSSGWIVFWPVKWAKDKTNFYFSTSRPYSNYYGDGKETPTTPWCANPSEVSLIKVDLETGDTEFVFGNRNAYDDFYSKDLLDTYVYTISPSELYLAYSLQDRTHPNITVRNLETKREIKIPVKNIIENNAVITKLTWLPDETELVADYTVCGTLEGKQVTIKVGKP